MAIRVQKIRSASDPFVQPRTFLEHVCHRTTGDIPNDLRLFAFIKSKATEEVISIADARYIACGIRRLFKHADATGDDHTLDLAMKHLAKWHNPDKEKEETDTMLPASAPVLFTHNIKDIAPDYEPVDTPARRAFLQKYNGIPDANTELVDRRAEELMGETE